MNAGMGAGIAFLATAAGAVFMFVKPQPADVYDMTVKTAYDRLTHADFGPHHGDPMTASGNGYNVVTWGQNGNFNSFTCKMHLDPLPNNKDKTKVSLDCFGASPAAGGADGMLHVMMRNEYIERIDATLKGRPFNKELAQGATAARWPGDGVDGSIGTAVNKAIQMQGDMAKLQREAEQAAIQSRAEHEASTPDSAQGAEPAPAN